MNTIREYFVIKKIFSSLFLTGKTGRVVVVVVEELVVTFDTEFSSSPVLTHCRRLNPITAGQAQLRGNCTGAPAQHHQLIQADITT